MQAYRDRYAELEKAGSTVVGLSVDDVDTLKRWKAELKLPFRLLSDAKGAVAARYGGTSGGYASRATFVVGKDKKITKIVEGADAIDPSTSIAACAAH
jgi:peroxiredoxin